jgi:DNA-binding response OmpR family regulator
MSHGKILLVSYERALLKTRMMLLQSTGYQVVMADNIGAARDICRTISLDLVIIGHSIPSSDQAELAAVVRQDCPGVPLMVILRSELENNAAGFEYTVNAQDGPGVLLNVVNSILRPREIKQQYA